MERGRLLRRQLEIRETTSRPWQLYHRTFCPIASPKLRSTLETCYLQARLSALHRKVFMLNQPPHADFSVFTLYNKRFLKAMKYRTFLPTMEGGYISREVPGPASYSQWLGCFRVWKTAVVMLKVIDLALLQRYETHIENLVKLLPGCWHLIANADDRGRSEHMARLQLQVQMWMAMGNRHQRAGCAHGRRGRPKTP